MQILLCIYDRLRMKKKSQIRHQHIMSSFLKEKVAKMIRLFFFWKKKFHFTVTAEKVAHLCILAPLKLFVHSFSPLRLSFVFAIYPQFLFASLPYHCVFFAHIHSPLTRIFLFVMFYINTICPMCHIHINQIFCKTFMNFRKWLHD